MVREIHEGQIFNRLTPQQKENGMKYLASIVSVIFLLIGTLYAIKGNNHEAEFYLILASIWMAADWIYERLRTAL